VGEQTPYVLGHSDIELRRLERQALRIDPVTRRFVEEAGIGPGMRVLDVGSGAGDVALLLADVVGPSGAVVGFDRSEDGIVAARAKVTKRGLRNVQFHVGTIDALDLGKPFDAVVGRYVLQFQADPTALLAAVAEHAAPGGLVVFHEIDWSGVSSDPAVPTFERLRASIERTIGESGANVHSGLGLPAVFASAGLGDPVVRIEQAAGAGANAREVLVLMADLAGTLTPNLVRLGAVREDNLDVDALVERMLTEATPLHSLVRSHFQVGAWTRA
jgi:SAM-dependent methyltransferase